MSLCTASLLNMANELYVRLYISKELERIKYKNLGID